MTKELARYAERAFRRITRRHHLTIGTTPPVKLQMPSMEAPSLGAKRYAVMAKVQRGTE